ncbi:unnamed protein product [Mucor fragilis]
MSEKNKENSMPKVQPSISNNFTFEKNKNVTVNQKFRTTDSQASGSSKRSSEYIVATDKTETEANKKQKTTKYLYLEGRSVDEEPVINDIKWEIGSYDVSKHLLLYRDKCIKLAKSQVKMKSDIDILALNSIYFISENNRKYGIQASVFEVMIKETMSKYRVEDDVN